MEEKKKNNKGLIIIIVILLILLCGLVSFIVYDKLVLNGDTKIEANKKESNTTESVDNSDGELNESGLYIENLINRYEWNSEIRLFLYDGLYGKKLATDLDESYVRLVTASNIKRNLESLSFSSDEFHDSLKLLFGNQLQLNDADFTVRYNLYKYDSTIKSYTFVQDDSGYGGTSAVAMQRKIVKAKKSNNKIEVDVAVAVLDGNTLGVYKNYDSKDPNKMEKVEGVTSDTFNIDSNYDKLNQYRYTFNYDKENNNYYLYSIELI